MEIFREIVAELTMETMDMYESEIRDMETNEEEVSLANLLKKKKPPPTSSTPTKPVEPKKVVARPATTMNLAGIHQVNKPVRGIDAVHGREAIDAPRRSDQEVNNLLLLIAEYVKDDSDMTRIWNERKKQKTRSTNRNKILLCTVGDH